MRAVELFDFEYTLEMYKPKEKRRWGYFALPVLHHDRLVGKVDAIADRKASVLQVNAVHQDVRFTRAMTTAVNAELQALAEWLRSRRRALRVAVSLQSGSFSATSGPAQACVGMMRMAIQALTKESSS